MAIMCSIYLLIGLLVFLWMIDGETAKCSVLFALAAPVVIVGYPYFLMKRILHK